MVERFYSLFVDLLCNPYFDSNRLRRAREALDGLLEYDRQATEFCRDELESDPSPENHCAALVLGDFGGDQALMKLALVPEPKPPEVWCGIRDGLRLCRLTPVWDNLVAFLDGSDRWAILSVVDAIVFHRLTAKVSLVTLLHDEDAEVRAAAVGILGRCLQAEHRAAIAPLLNDTNAVVRRQALAAAARTGLPGLVKRCCTMACASPPCLNSIRFLGVIASKDEAKLLCKLLEAESTAAAALDALGRYGAAEHIPDIIASMKSPVTAEPAARALERISGRTVPRNPPPPPPQHLTEDELDFWFHPGDPVPEAAEEWWHQNHYYFESGKRYQGGACISDDPLGDGFHQLPDEVQADVYLRERALNADETPDWELETWPEFVRNPSWANGAA